MSMHLVHGVQVHGKSKIKKKPGWKQKLAEHEEFLKRMGVKNTKSNYRHDIPNYKTGPRVTSDVICSHGPAKEPKEYTGNEISGIATMHKSNAVPIRKDNKQAAIDVAAMRR
jgi:hypothetical protein